MPTSKYSYAIVHQVLANNFGASLLCPLWARAFLSRGDLDKPPFDGATHTPRVHPGLSLRRGALRKCVRN